jgi:GT2 family glycosyltransferase
MISVIIPSWNGRHLLERALPPLIRQLPEQVKIIVVDNGSTDGSVEWLKAEWKTVVAVSLPENRGFAGAVNAGMAAAGDDDVVLVNNDTEALPGWIDALIDARSRYSQFHIFSSRVLHAQPPHLVDTAGDGFTIAGFGYKKGWLKADDPDFDQPAEVFSASGCAMLIRREVLQHIGMFDEDFFAFGEDLDFSFRARLAGFRVLYVPNAKILHSVRSTAAPHNTLFWYHRNLIWILVKNLPASLWFLYAPHIGAHIILITVRSVAGGWFKLYCQSMTAAVRGIPRMLERRRSIQKMRTVTLADIRRHVDAHWVSIHWELHKRKKKKAFS